LEGYRLRFSTHALLGQHLFESLGFCLTLIVRMTIDERLDRLTERHEALTQTVELMILEHREWEAKTERWQAKAQGWQAQTQEWQAQTQQWLAKAQGWQDKNQILMSQVLESIDTLARVAHVHEGRITNLEGQTGS
jgi:hypothetical protein